MKDALLDYIFDNCDAAYISDLRQKMIFQEYADMILEIEDTKFSVEEWNYVYRYLTGANAVFSAVAEVKEALRSWMQVQPTTALLNFSSTVHPPVSNGTEIEFSISRGS